MCGILVPRNCPDHSSEIWWSFGQALDCLPSLPQFPLWHPRIASQDSRKGIDYLVKETSSLIWIFMSQISDWFWFLIMWFSWYNESNKWLKTQTSEERWWGFPVGTLEEETVKSPFNELIWFDLTHNLWSVFIDWCHSLYILSNCASQHCIRDISVRNATSEHFPQADTVRPHIALQITYYIYFLYNIQSVFHYRIWQALTRLISVIVKLAPLCCSGAM